MSDRHQSHAIRPDALALGTAEADAAGITRLSDLVAVAHDFAKASKADNTRRAYGYDWQRCSTARSAAGTGASGAGP